MIRTAWALALFLASCPLSAGVATAASFDCSKAATPFETAICEDSDLSAADERLARTYATAIGGLSDAALAEMRTGQRAWLDYARHACTRDALPLQSGEYDERGLSCLADLFNTRSRSLEQSRMLDGTRFYPVSWYKALPDPYEADNPDSYWPVARHELSIVQIDGNEAFAHAFNDTVRAEGEAMSAIFSSTDEADDASTDSNISMEIKEFSGPQRITLLVTSYWYGHGAAHGNGTISYRHYLIKEGRFMQADDLFVGEGWRAALLDLAVAAAEAEHGDDLMLDDTSYIADSVADPTRWDLSSPYDLVIQFQPYEISAYAYGAPTVRISWDALDAYLAPEWQRIRSGY